MKELPTLSERARSRRNARRRGRRDWDGYQLRERDAAERRARRARERSLPQEAYSRAQVWAKTNGACGICGAAINPVMEWHVDHIVPLAMEGSPGDVLSNTQPSHPLCNKRKGHRSTLSILDAPCMSSCNADPTRPDLT